MAVATPVQGFVATIMSGTAVAGSSSLTATFNITGAFEAHIPVRSVQAANVSAAPEIYVFRSCDGGASYSNVGMAAFSVVRSSNADYTRTIRVETGQYCFQLLSGGPNTVTFALNTAYTVSCLLNT